MIKENEILNDIITEAAEDMFRVGKDRETQFNNGTELWKKAGRGIMAAYFIVITVVYPFYAPGGYLRIGEVKYLFFRNVTLVTIAAAFPVVVLLFLKGRGAEGLAEQYRRMSVTDWFAYGYLLAVMLSYLCSAYKADALWGVDGWYMGVISQMLFILLYFLFSRFFLCSRRWLAIWLGAAAVVFLLGILNRYSVYPIVMEGQTETFLSTLGNINWYSGYWAVAASAGMTLYWCGEAGIGRAAAGIFSGIAILAGITQGSSSAYLVYMMIFAVLLILSLSSSRRLYRFLELCMIFAAACGLGKVMGAVPGFHYNYGNNTYPMGSWITGLFLEKNAAWLLFCVAVFCYGLLWAAERYGGFRIEEHIRLKRTATAALGLGIVAVSVLLLGGSGLLQGGGLYGDGGIIFPEDWGNGRGTAWNCGIGAYRSMNLLQKTVGVGPDCFADYVYGIPELARQLLNQFGNQRLTNAHNEWLTLLVNTGWAGLFCYGGLFITALFRYGKRAKEQPLLYVCLMSLSAYTIHNMVSFQQILSTPYFFIMLGLGEGLARGLPAKEQGC
ncbi:MAG: O-antigen ligase family protein [Clostridiales bacterium]|nr:O-antigen ligase family protein [Clostridiales bacterium]